MVALSLSKQAGYLLLYFHAADVALLFFSSILLSNVIGAAPLPFSGS